MLWLHTCIEDALSSFYPPLGAGLICTLFIWFLIFLCFLIDTQFSKKKEEEENGITKNSWTVLLYMVFKIPWLRDSSCLKSMELENIVVLQLVRSLGRDVRFKAVRAALRECGRVG